MGQDMPDFAGMDRETLLPHAKELGVPTRQRKTKAWRPKADIAKDCEEAWRARRREASTTSNNKPPTNSEEEPAARRCQHATDGEASMFAKDVVPQQLPPWRTGHRKPSTASNNKPSTNSADEAAARRCQHTADGEASMSAKNVVPHQSPPNKSILDFFSYRTGPPTIPPTDRQGERATAQTYRSVMKPMWMRSKTALKNKKALESTPMAKEAARKRKAQPKELEATRKRMAQPKELEAARKRMAQPKEVEAARKRKARPKEMEATRKRMARLRESSQSLTGRIQYAKADRQSEILLPNITGEHQGTWQVAAAQIAAAEGASFMDSIPPPFAGLNDLSSMKYISQMYSFLNAAQWTTCVVCWRAWYSVGLASGSFDRTHTKHQEEQPRAWFDPRHSAVLRCNKPEMKRWCLLPGVSSDKARTLLQHEYAKTIQAKWEAQSAVHDSVTICQTCAKEATEDDRLKHPTTPARLCDYAVDPVLFQHSVQQSSGQALPALKERWHDHDGASSEQHIVDPRDCVLGLSIEEFAPAVAALSDSEEMVLALIHPLLQVYTIPRTGQLAYVGHICNFRQKVTKFLSSLPTLPQEMPFIKVRPRTLGT